MKTLTIIPAYQVAEYLERVINDTRKYLDDILVVDDGSSDGTYEVASNCGVYVIRHKENLGKGSALKTGFAYAIENDYEVVITLDGDGQHEPKYIPDFISAYKNTGADLIIGSRTSDKSDMPFPRRCSNFLTSHILSGFLHTKIEDSQSGYRLIKTDLLKMIKLKSKNYQLETEIIIKAVKAGFKIDFVPIKVVYGSKFKTSIRGLTDTFRWIRLVLEEI
jgi:glycosyltransferase involved in cell wall biosynthesis